MAKKQCTKCEHLLLAKGRFNLSGFINRLRNIVTDYHQNIKIEGKENRGHVARILKIRMQK
jgi:uncharacterized protein YsxB (DUF464 family)